MVDYRVKQGHYSASRLISQIGTGMQHTLDRTQRTANFVAISLMAPAIILIEYMAPSTAGMFPMGIFCGLMIFAVGARANFSPAAFGLVDTAHVEEDALVLCSGGSVARLPFGDTFQLRITTWRGEVVRVAVTSDLKREDLSMLTDLEELATSLAEKVRQFGQSPQYRTAYFPARPLWLTYSLVLVLSLSLYAAFRLRVLPLTDIHTVLFLPMGIAILAFAAVLWKLSTTKLMKPGVEQRKGTGAMVVVMVAIMMLLQWMDAYEPVQ
jgi:hypothetical protein